MAYASAGDGEASGTVQKEDSIDGVEEQWDAKTPRQTKTLGQTKIGSETRLPPPPPKKKKSDGYDC